MLTPAAVFSATEREALVPSVNTGALFPGADEPKLPPPPPPPPPPLGLRRLGGGTESSSSMVTTDVVRLPAVTLAGSWPSPNVTVSSLVSVSCSASKVKLLELSPGTKARSPLVKPVTR